MTFDVGKPFRENQVGFFVQLFAGIQIFGDQDELGLAAVWQGWLTRQHKAGGAFTDVITVTGQVGIIGKLFGKAVGYSLSCPNGGSLG